MKSEENEKKLTEIIQDLKGLLKDLKKNKIPENLEIDLSVILFKIKLNVYDADQIVNVKKNEEIAEDVIKDMILNPDPWLFAGLIEKVNEST